jgi:hypothetical protein
VVFYVFFIHSIMASLAFESLLSLSRSILGKVLWFPLNYPSLYQLFYLSLLLRYLSRWSIYLIFLFITRLIVSIHTIFMLNPLISNLLLLLRIKCSFLGYQLLLLSTVLNDRTNLHLHLIIFIIDNSNLNNLSIQSEYIVFEQ